MLKHTQIGGKLCSLLKTNPLAILHLFAIPCHEILNNNLFFSKIKEHDINYVQLSPIQKSCLIENHNEVRIDNNKRWFLCYQPINNTIGNELHGSEQIIIDTIKKFEQRNINVIADVVLSHLRHVYTYEDNPEIGVKFIRGRNGLKLLLHMSKIKLLNDTDTINTKTIKYTFYDIMYNLEKFYGEDIILLETNITDLNGATKKIINEIFYDYISSQARIFFQAHMKTINRPSLAGNYYTALGIDRNTASNIEINEAYRLKSLQWNESQLGINAENAVLKGIERRSEVVNLIVKMLEPIYKEQISFLTYVRDVLMNDIERTDYDDKYDSLNRFPVYIPNYVINENNTIISKIELSLQSARKKAKEDEYDNAIALFEGILTNLQVLLERCDPKEKDKWFSFKNKMEDEVMEIIIKKNKRNQQTLLNIEDIKSLRIDLLKFINEIQNIICDYLEINISEFKNIYYDILNASYPGRPNPIQLIWFLHMPKLNHNNKLVQEKTFSYLKKLSEIGIVGLRFDFAVGFDTDIISRYCQYFHKCVPLKNKSKIYIYHEIVNIHDGSLYTIDDYLYNINYKVDLTKSVNVSYTSYANLYDTIPIILNKNYYQLRGLSIDNDDVVVFSETHDTLWNKPIDDKDNMWYKAEIERKNPNIPLDIEYRKTLSMLMLCYFLSRSCRIPLIYLNQINLDDIFKNDTYAYSIYNRYKPNSYLQSNVFKCLQFRKFLIENKIGNESGNEDNWEKDANWESVYISTKFIGSREAVATIFINFENNTVHIPDDKINIPPYGVHIKYETTKEVFLRLGFKIKN
jgi:hypothetical protein